MHHRIKLKNSFTDKTCIRQTLLGAKFYFLNLILKNYRMTIFFIFGSALYITSRSKNSVTKKALHSAVRRVDQY